MLARTRRAARRAERGMSLIEVILIIVIVGVVAYPLARLSNANLTELGKYATMTKATYDLQSVMEQILADYISVDAVRGGYTKVRTNWANKTGTTNSGQFTYNVTVSPETVLDGVTYTPITATVSGGGLKKAISLKTWIVKRT